LCAVSHHLIYQQEDRMPEFTVTIAMILRLVSSATVRARNEDAAAEKIQHQIDAGTLSVKWEVADPTHLVDGDWEEESLEIEIEGVE
jgi:hypothetical protein